MLIPCSRHLLRAFVRASQSQKRRVNSRIEKNAMSRHPSHHPSGKPKQREGRKKRLSIGFLLASLHTGASRALWPGLIDAAERHDVNLVCFPGGRLRTQVAYEAQRNA